MIPIPSGEWKRTRYAGIQKTYICIACPYCNRSLVLSNQHSVGDHGIVIPEVTCPFRNCSFRGLIALDGWDPDLTPVERTDDLPSPPPEAGS